MLEMIICEGNSEEKEHEVGAGKYNLKMQEMNVRQGKPCLGWFLESPYAGL